MALRNIYVEGDPILRKVCRPVEKFDEKLATLLDDMHETLDKAEGVGLAAPQVGMCRRIFIMHLGDDDKVEAINPEILKTSGSQHVVEGCLSCPDKWGYVTRPKRLCSERRTETETGMKESSRIWALSAYATRTLIWTVSFSLI